MTAACAPSPTCPAPPARDPLWALTCVVFGPFRGGFYLAKCLLVGLILALVLFLGVQFAVETLRMKGAWLHRVGNVGAGLVALAVFLRMASRPMIDHFGDWRATRTAPPASPQGKRSGRSPERRRPVVG